jgi:hypothetical protein
MSVLNYTTMDRIFSKIHRDLKGTTINETDVIEWVGEALEFLKVPQILVQDVTFLKVVDYHSVMPANLHLITQIARDNEYDPNNACTCETTPGAIEDEDEETAEIPETSDPCCECAANCPAQFLDLSWTYEVWTSHAEFINHFTPVRLSTHTFFNSIVCKEKDMTPYASCKDEYTIVGETEKRLRYNFINGMVAISYLRNAFDPETGYPLIPDNISYITAIVYFIKWKIAEMYDWAGREGWGVKAEKAEVKWLKYVGQAKSFMKMPKTLDQYQNLLEQSHHLLPNHRKYYNYFGTLGEQEVRNYNRDNKIYQ